MQNSHFRLPHKIAQAGAARGSLADAAGYHLARQSRHLRARLLAAATGSTAKPDAVEACAIACELLQEANLVRQDLVALRPSRRGQPALWRAYGEDTALILSDHLSACAVQTIAAHGAPEIASSALPAFAAAMSRTAAGQHATLIMADDAAASRASYEHIARQTSGTMLSLPLQLAGILRGLPAEQVDDLASCGEQLGLALAILRDLTLGIADPSTRSKHPALTAPVVEAKTVAPGVDPYHLLVAGGAPLDQIRQRCRLWLVQAAADAIDYTTSLPSDMRSVIRCYAERGLQAPSEIVAPILLEAS